MIIHPPNKSSHHLLYFLFMLCLFQSFLIHAFQNTNIQCIDEEREALLEFKQGIQVDHCGILSSWEDKETIRGCCKWDGVICNSFSGHVIAINLGGNYDHPCLEGELSTSLVKLKHLKYLDLSFNKFQAQAIPRFIGSIANLKHLNLSKSGFIGKIPLEFGNLSHLTSLDLSENHVDVKNLRWISRLTSLSVINLSNIDLSEVRDWFQIVINLPFLKVLKMDWCSLSSTIPFPLSYNNSSSTLHYLSLAHNNFGVSSVFTWLFNVSKINNHLVHLDLSDNTLPGPIPSVLKSMHSLSYLDLSSNAFEGPIPMFLGNMHSLSHLDLSANSLEGPISSCFTNMQSLSYLDISGNTLDGHIPETIVSLKHIVHLDLSWNNFEGRVPKNLGELCSLQFLELSYNNLTSDLADLLETLYVCSHKSIRFLNLESNHFWGSVSDTIQAFSSLRELYVDANLLNGTISQGIASLSMLENLRLSSNSLNDIISENHFANLSKLRDLDLSDNPKLLVNISADWDPPFQLDTIYMSSCILGPHFPKWLQTQTQISWIDISIAGISDMIPDSFWNSLSSKLEYLNMSHNSIHGVLPSDMSITLRELPQIDLSSNSIEGAIPSFLGNISSLSLNDNLFSDPNPLLCPNTKVVLSNLDLSNNLFSGELPDCWMYFDTLSILRLENNNFSGNLPVSIGTLKNLQALHLRNNNFSGELPISLQHCTSLVLLDVSYNSLTGYVPPIIGHNLKRLGILSLRSNHFSGVVPLSLCQLSHLQILDLSVNHIYGNIPRCINNLKAMTNTSDLLPDIQYQYDFSVIMKYYDAASIMWKRKDQIFRNFLGQVKFIHMSDNMLEGDIPEGISGLVGLVSLDLSGNKLNGSITPQIGKLSSLELLDLSNNHLSGEIPTTLANLNFLGMLNLSYNNLSGKIPVGTLLQGFDTSTYMGNPKLCGAPLDICPEDQPPTNTTNGVDIITQQDVNDSDDIFPGLYISVVLGFIIGFWGVCGPLAIKRSWRYAFFRFVDNVKVKVCMMMNDN